MKGEILVIDNDLVFVFKRSEVKSRADKQAIALMISHLYHTYCVDINPRESMVDEILSMAKKAYVGLKMDDKNNEPRLKIIDFTEMRLRDIKKMVYELAEIKDFE